MVVAWRASVAATITSTMATTAADSYTTVAPVLTAHHHYLYRPALVPLSCDFFLKINASLIIVLNKRKPWAFRWSWSGSPRELNSPESRKTWTEEKIKLFNFPVNRMTFCWQQKANIHSRTLNAYLVGPCQYVNDLCFEIVLFTTSLVTTSSPRILFIPQCTTILLLYWVVITNPISGPSFSTVKVATLFQAFPKVLLWLLGVSHPTDENVSPPVVSPIITACYYCSSV